MRGLISHRPRPLALGLIAALAMAPVVAFAADPDTYSAGAMTYDLRRLRLHRLIERLPRSHRYRITPTGAQVAMFYARLYTRALRPACSLHASESPRAQRAFDRLDAALAKFLEEVKLAA